MIKKEIEKDTFQTIPVIFKNEEIGKINIPEKKKKRKLKRKNKNGKR